MQPEVLPYAASPPRHRPPLLRRHFHVWALPLIWLIGGWGSRIHYGDEFSGFVMAHLPSAIIIMPLMKLTNYQPNLSTESGFVIVVAIGFALWTFVGWLLDRLRGWRWMYLLMPIAFYFIARSRIAVPGHVPPIADYPGQNWEKDALYVAYCWAVYLVALIFLLAATLAALARARWSRRLFLPHPADR